MEAAGQQETGDMADFDREMAARHELLRAGTTAAMAGDLVTGQKLLVEQLGMSEAAVTWLAENAAALKAHNAWIEENGLPLAKYRMF